MGGYECLGTRERHQKQGCCREVQCDSSSKILLTGFNKTAGAMEPTNRTQGTLFRKQQRIVWYKAAMPVSQANMGRSQATCVLWVSCNTDQMGVGTSPTSSILPGLCIRGVRPFASVCRACQAFQTFYDHIYGSVGNVPLQSCDMHCLSPEHFLLIYFCMFY